MDLVQSLGVLSRKPEIKYHDSNAMDEIIPIQAKLLENAYSLCIKGGNIVYSTCTINKKENEKQIEQFIKKHSRYACGRRTYYTSI